MINENLEKLVSLARDKKASAFKDIFTSEVDGRLATKIADMKQSLAKSMFAKKEGDLSREITEDSDVEHKHGDVTHSHADGDKEHTHKSVEHTHDDGTKHSHIAGDAEHTHEGTLPPALQKAIDKKKKGKKDDDDEVDEGKDGGEGDKAAYQKYFQGMLKKYGVKDPSELSGDKMKKFYDEVDAGWKGDNEND